MGENVRPAAVPQAHGIGRRMAAYVSGAALLAAALGAAPALAGTFVVPKGCTAYVTVQHADCEVAQQTGTALDDGTPPPLSFDDINAKYQEKLPSSGERDGERFSSKAQHLTMLLIEVGGFDSGTSHSKALLDRVKADVAAVRAETGDAKDMRVGYSGDVAISAAISAGVMSAIGHLAQSDRVTRRESERAVVKVLDFAVGLVGDPVDDHRIG